MHEMSLASDLIGQVLMTAAENNLSKISEVQIDCGVLRQVIPQMMQTAWQSVSADTIADGALLEIKQVSAEARCRNCGFEYEPKFDYFVCEKCGQADAEILQGDEIILKSVIGDTE